MTIEEKRDEVVRRRVASITYDAENSTSWSEELLNLLSYGVKPIDEWTEEELDAYLSEHDEEGQSIEEDSEDE